MGFLKAPKPPAPDPTVVAAQQRAEERAVAQEGREARAASARLRRVRTGGLRLLFSPTRDAAGNAQQQLGTTLGVSGGQ